MVAQTALDLALFSANKVPIKTAKWCSLVHFNASLCIIDSVRRSFVHELFLVLQRVGWEGLEPSTNALKVVCSTEAI